MGEHNAFQIQDTAYTKIFVGGLAWETKKDAVERYFEQFGEIQEAVVITDKATGRSKGYGFVTFSDPDSANRACRNPSPVIDGRRANCNLAFLGAQKPRSSTPQQQHVAGRYRGSPRMVVSPQKVFQGSSSSSGYNHHPPGQCVIPPYSSFGYHGYSQEAVYPMNYYSVYGNQQYQPYYPSGSSSGFLHNLYPVYGHGSQARLPPIPLPIQYPQMIQYLPQQHYASPGLLPVPPSTTLSATTNTAQGSQITSERSSST